MATKTVPLNPVGNRVLVRPTESESVTPGGIVLPDVAKERPTTGVVLAIGPGRVLDNGDRVPVDLTEGQTVYFKTYAGSEIEYEGETFKILTEDDVLAVLND